MVSDLDIYRAANLVIKQHGEGSQMIGRMMKATEAVAEGCSRLRRIGLAAMALARQAMH